MKSRFSAREAALVLIPSLALGAFAQYSQRVESIGPRGLYVEKSELVPATPYDVSRGYSHYMKVTLNYGGWKPNWWTSEGAYNNSASVSPSTFDWADKSFLNRATTFAIGDDLTIKRHGKSVIVKRARGHFAGISAEKGRYELKHYLALSQVPSNEGEVIFKGIYALRELEPLRWEKVVRRTNEKMLLSVDRNPHATIVSLKRPLSTPPHMAIEVQVRHSPRENGEPARICWEDIKILDSRSRVFSYGPHFNLGWRGIVSVNENPSVSRTVIDIMPNPSFIKNARPPLTVRGKISVNENWPIPFSHRLSP